MVAFPGSGVRPERSRFHLEKQLTPLFSLYTHSEYVTAKVSTRASCLYSTEIEIAFIWIERELPINSNYPELVKGTSLEYPGPHHQPHGIWVPHRSTDAALSTL